MNAKIAELGATVGWQLAAWTMLHFLWIGAGVALVGAMMRIACRRRTAALRYAVSLLTLAVVAATPAAIASWLAAHPEYVVASAAPVQPRALPGGNVDAGTAKSRLAFSGALPLVERDQRTRATRSRPSAGGSPREAHGEAVGARKTSSHAISASSPLPQPLPIEGRGAEEKSHNPRAEPGAEWWSSVADRAIPHLPWLWLIGSPLTFALLATGLVGARRLRQAARPLVDGPVYEACRRMRVAMGVAREVTVAVCDSIAQPLLIGIVKPCILLPASALAGWTAEELEMVLVHELAHVRRWDNLVNLLQRIGESMLFFHPAVWLVSRQVRRDREECCDAVVVGRTQRAREYAELLVSVAASRRRENASPLLAASAMADHPLTSRVRRILKLEDEPMLVSRSTIGAAGLVIAALVTTAFVLPLDRGQAEEGAAKTGKNLPADEDGQIYTVVYPISDIERIDLRKWVKATSAPSVDANWFEKNQSVVLGAPRDVHREVARLLQETRDQSNLADVEQDDMTAVLDELNRGLERKLEELKMRGISTGVASKDVELPKLARDIERYQDLIDDVRRELTEFEVRKQTAIEASQNPALLDQAIKVELEKDPMIANYKQQLFSLDGQIQRKQATGANPKTSELKRYLSMREETQDQMDEYRKQFDQTVRKKLQDAPNEGLRAALVEYKIRVEDAQNRLADYQEKLELAEGRLRELSVADPAYAMLEKGIENDQAVVAELQHRIAEHALRKKTRERNEAESRIQSTPVTASVGKMTEHAYPRTKFADAALAAWLRVATIDPAAEADDFQFADIVWHEDKNQIVVQAPEFIHRTINRFFERDADYQEDSARHELSDYDRIFRAGGGNPAETLTYRIDRYNSLVGYPTAATDFLDGLTKDPYGPQAIIEWRWIAKDKRIAITAPRSAHAFFYLMLAKDSPYPELAAQQRDRAVAAEEKAEGGSQPEGADATASAAGDDFSAGEQTPAAAAKLFPADEERIADLAYRMLRWEVEPLTDDDLKWVKEQGYEGGVRILPGDMGGPTKVLVGIHVWPVRNFDELATVLQKPELPLLSPVRVHTLQWDREANGWPLKKERVGVLQDNWREAINQYQPPRVVDTQPRAGSVVPADAVTEIKVYYSQPMQDRSWSWSTSTDKGEFPETTGEPRYSENRQNCILPVKLEPGKKYALRLNSEKFKNFKGLDGRPAEPYLLEFETRAKDKVQKATAERMSTQPESAEAISEQAGGGRGGRLYDGKRLEEWTALWSTELKLSRRLEALEAIGAFARAGQAGAEELILDYATEYKVPPVWTRPARDDRGKVLLKALEILAPQALPNGIGPASYDEVNPSWLAPLVDRLSNDPARYRNLAINLLRDMRPSPQARETLRVLTKTEDAELREIAKEKLDWAPRWAKPLLVMDKDGDKAVTEDEFVDAIAAHGEEARAFTQRLPLPFVPPSVDFKAMIREKIWPWVAVADKDGDGALTREELVEGASAVEQKFSRRGGGGGYGGGGL